MAAMCPTHPHPSSTLPHHPPHLQGVRVTSKLTLLIRGREGRAARRGGGVAAPGTAESQQLLERPLGQ